MKYIIRFTTITLLYILFMFHSEPVLAGFDIETNDAGYDSNSGVLTVYGSDFNDSEYSADVPKMKLGDVTLSGYCEFKEGVMRVYLRNKEEINRQEGFYKDNLIESGLFFSSEAIKKSYRPPNSVNVVLVSSSNEKTLPVKVTGLKTRIRIDSFTPDVTTLSGQGGDVILTLNGDNLENGIFKIHDLNSSITHNLSVGKTSASARINCPANYMDTNRTDTFVLYSNGFETIYRISITVLSQKENTEHKTDNPSDSSKESQANNNSSNNNHTAGNSGAGNNESGKPSMNGNGMQDTAGNQWGTKPYDNDSSYNIINNSSGVRPPDYGDFTTGTEGIPNIPFMSGSDSILNQSERSTGSVASNTARDTDSNKINSAKVTAVIIVIILTAVTGAFLLTMWFIKRRRK